MPMKSLLLSSAAMLLALSLTTANAQAPDIEGGAPAGPQVGGPDAPGLSGPENGAPAGPDAGGPRIGEGSLEGPMPQAGPESAPPQERLGEVEDAPDAPTGPEAAEEPALPDERAAEADEPEAPAQKEALEDQPDEPAQPDEKAAEAETETAPGPEAEAEAQAEADARAETEARTETTVELEQQQVTQIKQYFSQHRPQAKSVSKSAVSVSIGIAVPGTVTLYPLPPALRTVVVIAPDCPLHYFVWGPDIVLVGSCTREVVEIIYGVV
jgi:hypothetical protein